MEIKLQDICFTYKRGDVNILDMINFKIYPSKVTGIIGANGSGKTTLLEIISALKIPSKGKLSIDNIIVNRRSSYEDKKKAKKLIGYLPQNIEKHFCCDTIKNDLNYFLDALGVSYEDLDIRIKNIFEILNLDEDILNRDPFSLSSGQLRQVALSFILVYNPSIIILDEPTVGLDLVGKQKLLNLLTKIKKLYCKTIVIASQDLDFINSVADNIVALKEGKVIRSGKKEELISDVNFLREIGVSIPQMALFSNFAYCEKNIKLGYYADINDLVKDILRKR